MIASLFALAVLSWTEPATVQVESLTFDVAALKALPRVEVRVKEGEKTTVYKGVPLRALIANRLNGANAMADLRGLSDAVLLVRATDDYQVAVSAAAVAMDETGERYLVAFERDGSPLGEKEAPAKLIIPADSHHVRWVRNMSGVDLVRMPRKAAKTK